MSSTRRSGARTFRASTTATCALPRTPRAGTDCYDPTTMQLRVTRPGCINGIKELAKHVAGELAKEVTKKPAERPPAPLPHLTSIHQWAKHWNKGDRKEDYDVNALATRQ